MKLENEVKNGKRRKTIKVMVPDEYKRYSDFFHLFLVIVMFFDWKPVLLELVRLGPKNGDTEQIVRIFESLKQLGIMKKGDIHEHKLIKEAMEEEKLQLLNWMVEWDTNGSLEGFYDTIYIVIADHITQ